MVPIESNNSQQLDVVDLCLLAEFFADNESLRVQQTSPSSPIYKNIKKRERIARKAYEILTDIVNAGDATPDALLESIASLEQGWIEEEKTPNPEASEDEIDLALGGLRRAASLIEENRGNDIYSRKDFQAWLKIKNEKLKQERLAKESVEPEIVTGVRTKVKEATTTRNSSMEEVKSLLADPNIRTIEDVKRVVTSEVKSAILQSILEDIDRKIQQGKEIARKEKGAAIEARTLGVVIGVQAESRPYQFIASAASGKILDARSIARMSPYTYLKNFLGYDLKNDTLRRTDLENFTNMLD